MEIKSNMDTISPDQAWEILTEIVDICIHIKKGMTMWAEIWNVLIKRKVINIVSREMT